MTKKVVGVLFLMIALAAVAISASIRSTRPSSDGPVAGPSIILISVDALRADVVLCSLCYLRYLPS